jgi:hypothetical protein
MCIDEYGPEARSAEFSEGGGAADREPTNRAAARPAAKKRDRVFMVLVMLWHRGWRLQGAFG